MIYSIQGYKYHMNNNNTTVGLVQLEIIETIIRRYIDNSEFYDKALIDISGITLIDYYNNSQPSYWLYTMKVDRRCDFVKTLVDKDVMAFLVVR